MKRWTSDTLQICIFFSFEDMRPSWPKLASLAQKTFTVDSFQFFAVILAAKG